MSDNGIQNTIHLNIKERMKSDEWNYEIAKGVLYRRERIKKRRIFTTSIASFSFAILIIVTLSLYTGGKPGMNDFDGFISRQLDGTYSEVFGEDSLLGFSKQASNESISYDSIDMLIDNALSLR
ncbi:MAG: hypothetical protein SVZ03_07495 [Spirochaetota bacterium]|nr:hypothetical protein [Spirochaetota bacterium]